MMTDNSHHLAAAAQRRRYVTLGRAEAAVTAAEHAGVRVSVTELARTAGVSRAWLYAQPELRERAARLAALGRRGTTTGAAVIPENQRGSGASVQRRLEMSLARNRQLAAENIDLREQLALALGRLRIDRALTAQHD